MRIPHLAGLAVAQQLARGGARALTVLKDRLPVHHDPAVPLSLLHPPPLSCWQIIVNLLGQGPELLQVVDHDIGREPLTQGATIVEARCPGTKPA